MSDRTDDGPRDDDFIAAGETVGQWCIPANEGSELGERETMTTVVYCKFWKLNGEVHRGDDLPAIEYASGRRDWYLHGKRHRERNRPAIIHADGSEEWWEHGRLQDTSIQRSKAFLRWKSEHPTTRVHCIGTTSAARAAMEGGNGYMLVRERLTKEMVEDTFSDDFWGREWKGREVYLDTRDFRLLRLGLRLIYRSSHSRGTKKLLLKHEAPALELGPHILRVRTWYGEQIHSLLSGLGMRFPRRTAGIGDFDGALLADADSVDEDDGTLHVVMSMFVTRVRHLLDTKRKMEFVSDLTPNKWREQHPLVGEDHTTARPFILGTICHLLEAEKYETDGADASGETDAWPNEREFMRMDNPDAYAAAYGEPVPDHGNIPTVAWDVPRDMNALHEVFDEWVGSRYHAAARERARAARHRSDTTDVHQRP